MLCLCSLCLLKHFDGTTSQKCLFVWSILTHSYKSIKATCMFCKFKISQLQESPETFHSCAAITCEGMQLLCSRESATRRPSSDPLWEVIYNSEAITTLGSKLRLTSERCICFAAGDVAFSVLQGSNPPLSHEFPFCPCRGPRYIFTVTR